MTIDEIRALFIARHKEAVEYLHLLVASPGLGNDEWPKLRDARKAEEDAAKDVCAVNRVAMQADRLRNEGTR